MLANALNFTSVPGLLSGPTFAVLGLPLSYFVYHLSDLCLMIPAQFHFISFKIMVSSTFVFSQMLVLVSCLQGMPSIIFSISLHLLLIFYKSFVRCEVPELYARSDRIHWVYIFREGGRLLIIILLFTKGLHPLTYSLCSSYARFVLIVSLNFSFPVNICCPPILFFNITLFFSYSSLVKIDCWLLLVK